MKICIISNYKKNGYGESTRPYYISINLLRMGHRILHLCDHEGVEDGIEYIRIKPDLWNPDMLTRAKDFLRLFYKLRVFNPDVVYVNQFNVARWAIQTKVLPEAKFVFDAHTSVHLEWSTFRKSSKEILDKVKGNEFTICLRSDAVICASDETRNYLISTYQLPESKFFTVGNATNIVPVTASEIIEAENQTSEIFTCLATLPFDGFLSNELALDYLFEIAAEVQKQSDRIRFLVVGGGEKPIPPVSNVFYTGYVPDLRKEILQADVCLMPYPDQAICGGARNKFCDFVALGKVVISSPEGLRGMQVLNDEKNCLRSQNAQEFAFKILELSANPKKLNNLRLQVLKLKGMFDWKDRAVQVSNIFEKII